MKNFWEKIKTFFRRIWNGLTTAGRIILGLILVAAVILISFAFSKESDKTSEENSSPEIAQVYEPSIGTPLPPDVNQEGVTGNVGGATTDEASTSTPQTNFIAPAAGVDDSKPIKYESSALRFAAVLPAYSQVNEQSDGVKFTSRDGTLHYIVSVNDAGTENLASIESQLRNSPTANNITYTNINNSQAIKFTAKGYGTGITFIANGKIYYLLGNSQFFSEFSLQ